MKGLVTVFGGSGFVGSQVVRALAKANARVRVAVRNPGRGYRLRMLGDVGQIEVVQANLRDRPSVAQALDGAQACVNAVGVLHESGRQSFEAVHAQGAGRIAEVAAAMGVRSLAQISALGADAASPAAYARSKAAGEDAVRAAFPAATLLRPSVIFGAEDSFFNRFAALATISPALPLIGGGETKFQPVHVADVAAAVVQALESDAARGGTFELGGPRVYSFRQLMEEMLEVIQRRRILIPIPFAVAEILALAGDAAAMAGLPPPLTTDQVALLRSDNVVAPGARGLADLGVAATALEPNLPAYLYVFRPGGQYAHRTGPIAAPPAAS